MRGIAAAAVTAVLQIPDLGFLLSDCHSPPVFWLIEPVFWQNETTGEPYRDPLSGQTKDEICVRMSADACARIIKLSRYILR